MGASPDDGASNAPISDPPLMARLLATSREVGNQKLEAAWKVCVMDMDAAAAKGLIDCYIVLDPYEESVRWDMKSRMGKKLLGRFEENGIQVLWVRRVRGSKVELHVTWKPVPVPPPPKPAPEPVVTITVPLPLPPPPQKPSNTCTCTIV